MKKEKQDWEKKYDRASIGLYVCILLLIFTTLYQLKFLLGHKDKIISLSEFECPAGYHLIPNSYYITDTTGDTLLIDHEIIHRYSYKILTNPQKHAAKILLSK